MRNRVLMFSQALLQDAYFAAWEFRQLEIRDLKAKLKELELKLFDSKTEQKKLLGAVARMEMEQ